MIKKILLHPLIWIFLLGLTIRTFKLDTLPYGFHVDEVKVGWNAYSLFKTGRDDWWHLFPLHYDSFGDQRPTGIMYATVPSVAMFGPTEFAVRFPAALFGSLGIVAVYFLCLKLKANSYKLSALAAFMAAISPWHISLSRATSEGIIASTLILFGLVFILRKKPSFLISSILFLLSYFFYHSARLLVPLFTTAVIFWQFLLAKKFKISGLVFVSIFYLLSSIFYFSPIARSRLNQVSIFTDLGVRDEIDRLPFEEGDNHIFTARVFHNKVVLYSTRILNEYFQYFSPKTFLSFGEAKPMRYATVLRGPILYIEFILLILGLVYAFRKITKHDNLLLLMALLILSPLPAAITTEDAPNIHRALLMSPFLSLFAGLGLYYLKNLGRFVTLVALLLLSLDFIYFTHQYIIHNPARDALTITRNAGVSELFHELRRLAPRYRQVLFTNRPDPLYTWYAFYSQPSPFAFNQGLAITKSQDFSYANLTFSQNRCPSHLLAEKRLTDTLAVDTEGCTPAPNTLMVAQIIRTSGGVPYTLWVYQPQP